MKDNSYGHVPLRVPAGWDGQNKALIIQLNRLLDDIYAQIGKLRTELKELKEGDSDGGTDNQSET